MSLPAFAKQGSVLSTPSWLSGTGNKIMFPRIFDNDAHRGTLPGLPAERFSMLFCSDHSSGTGYIGRADSDDWAGPWTDSGAAIASGANQRETPHPVYDPINNRVNLYVHDQSSTVTNGDQASRLLTTTTLAAGSFTDEGEIFPFGNHTGYAQVYWDAAASLFRANHLLNGDQAVFNGHSTSVDGETFTFGSWWSPNQQHIAGDNKCFGGVPFTIEIAGQWYLITNLQTVPRLTGYPGNTSAIVAVPIVSQSVIKPIGGYYTLVTPSVTTTDPDYRLTNYLSMYEESGTLYLYYTGQNNAGDCFICLAISDVGSASQTAPVFAPNSDGTVGGGTATTIFDWDAANDAFPTADLTMTAGSGSNASSQSAGNYYEMKYGSGSAQDLRLSGDATLNPATPEAVEFVIENLTLDNGDPEAQVNFQIGFTNSIASATVGCWVQWSGNDANLMCGRIQERNGSATNVELTNISAIPWLNTNENISEWMMSQPVTLRFRIHDHGDKLTIFANDTVVSHRDLSTDGLTTWTSGIFPYLRLLSSSPHPEFYARFTRMSLKTYEPATAPPANTAYYQMMMAG